MGRSYTPHEHERSAGQYRGGCRDKRRFTSKRQAAGTIRVMQQRHGIAGTSHLNAYKCKACHYWHVGNLIPEWLLRKD